MVTVNIYIIMLIEQVQTTKWIKIASSVHFVRKGVNLLFILDICKYILYDTKLLLVFKEEIMENVQLCYEYHC